PLPSPPIEGLQDMAPTVENRWVTSAVRAPMRAAAAAASQPAWPPPTTITSKPASIAILREQAPFSQGQGRNHAKSAPLFHVKHTPRGVNQSFTNTEIAEDNVEDVLDIHPAGQPAERRGGRPQFLGDQLLAPGGTLGERPV